MTTNSWLVSDLDGTVADGNLEKSFVDFLMKHGLYNGKQKLLALYTRPINLVLSRLEISSYRKAWGFRISSDFMEEMIESYAKSKYFPSPKKKIVDLIGDFAGNKLLLTGSHQLLAEAFVQRYEIEFDKIVGLTLSYDDGRVLRHPYAEAKVPHLPNGPLQVGLGDSYADRHFLYKCDNPIVVDGDRRIRGLAIRNRWLVMESR